MVGFGYTMSKNCNQKPHVTNQSDLFMHFLAMTCNGRVTMMVAMDKCFYTIVLRIK